MGEGGLHQIGQELRRLRLAAGLSGVDLATRPGVVQPAVSGSRPVAGSLAPRPSRSVP
jgi:transcriptional regulator with XRE-family HTH domain